MIAVPSQYQKNFFSTLVATPQNIALGATAGSGKTTTIVEACNMIPYGKRAIFVAFNKHIVKELKNRLPNSVECSTMHSFGARCIGGALQNGWFLDEKKQIKYIIPYFDGKQNREKWPIIYQIDRVMQLARATMTDNNREGIERLIDQYALDLDLENVGIVIKAIRKFREYNEEGSVDRLGIDFMDMIELCVRDEDIPMQQYDYVFVDECQDLTNLDRKFIQRIVRAKGRKIIVGDKNQAIYSFRGAAIDSFEQFAGEPNTITLPLSISYRCARSIVEEARKVYTDIEPWEKAIEGKVRKGKVEDIQEGDMVLCRNSRPLIEVFFKLIEANKKAYILGREIEKGLLALLKDFDSDEKTEGQGDRLKSLLDRLHEQLEAKGITKPLVHPKFIQLQEKIEIIKLLFSKFTTVSEVETFISEVFDDESRDGVALMTIHKSKGLENERVFIIERFGGAPLIPSQYAITEDQLKQEKNLQFVSITRAKKELVYLHI